MGNGSRKILVTFFKMQKLKKWRKVNGSMNFINLMQRFDSC